MNADTVCVAVGHGLGAEGLLAAKVVWGVGVWARVASLEPTALQLSPDFYVITTCAHTCACGRGVSSLVLQAGFKPDVSMFPGPGNAVGLRKMIWDK